MRRRAAAGVLALAACAAPACFVGIDEGLLRADAGTGGDAGADATAAPDAGSARVRCGDAACDPPVSVCCASSFGDTDYRNGACTTRNGCQTGDYFACTRPADCAYPGSAGRACCVVRISGGAFTSTTCAASCTEGDALCDGAGVPGDSGACPVGRACRASLEFPTLYQCAR